MVTIFNSRHMQKVTPREARVRQALNLLREEFDLGDEQAMWYWDGHVCGPGYVVFQPQLLASLMPMLDTFVLCPSTTRQSSIVVVVNSEPCTSAS